MKNLDQQLTQDIDQLCYNYSQILAQIIACPMFIGFFWYKVSVTLDWLHPFVLFGYYLVGYFLQRFVMSPISRHTYNQEKLEGTKKNLYFLPSPPSLFPSPCFSLR